METDTRVQFISEDLRACRVCLDTSAVLYSISDGLEDQFIQLMGVEYSDDDGLPQHLCPWCHTQLLRLSDFRARCHRSQDLLKQILEKLTFVSTDYIASIDRNHYKLSLNLVKIPVFSFNSLEKTIVHATKENSCDDSFDRDDLPDTDFKEEAIEPLKEANIEEPDDLNVKSKKQTDALVSNKETKRLVVEIDGLNSGQISVKTLPVKEAGKPKEKPKKEEDHKPKRIEIDGLNSGQISVKTLPVKEAGKPKEKPKKGEDHKTKRIEIDGLNSGQISVKTLPVKEAGKPKEKPKKGEDHKTKRIEIDSLNSGQISVKTLPVKEAGKPKEKPEKGEDHKTKRISNLIRFVAGKKTNAKPLTKWQLQLRRAENDFLPNFDYAEFESKHDCKLRILTMKEQLDEIEERKQNSNYLNLDFKCEQCGRGFEFEQSFKNHMAKHDPSNGKFECDVCHVYFRTQYLRHRHVDYHKMRFTCSLCGFVTRAKILARNHYLMHTGKVFSCEQCDASFTKSTSYYGHVRLSHPSNDHVCGVCGDSFIGARGLRNHHAKAHRELSKSKLECKTCGVHFVSLEAMTRHMDGRAQCDASLKACAACGAVFASEAALGEHASMYHEFACKECDQSFVSQSSLETHHQRIHLHQKWPAFRRTREMNKNNAALERHQLGKCKREKNTKSFKCPYCGKLCATKQGLQLHETLHTGEKPHKCPQCPQAFRQAGSLKRHHDAVHLGLDTRVPCAQCGMRFSNPSRRKLHVNTVHLRLPAPPRRRRED